MKTVGAYEAKTHLPKLLEEVAQGERITITKHGVPVAELSPISTRQSISIRVAIERLKAFQADHTLEGLAVRDLIDDGRKY